MSYQQWHTQEYVDRFLLTVQSSTLERYLQADESGYSHVFYKALGPSFTSDILRDDLTSDLRRATFFMTPASKKPAGHSSVCSKILDGINTAEAERLLSLLCDEGFLAANMEALPDPYQPSFTMMEVEGDGLCMLYTISVGLIGDPSLWHYLRTALHALMSNKEAFDFLMRDLHEATKMEGEITMDQMASLLERTTDKFDDPSMTPRPYGTTSVTDSRSLEGLHMYVLAHILRRPIVLLEDGEGASSSMVYLPFSVPPEELGPVLIYAYTNTDRNHFVAIVPSCGDMERVGRCLPFELLKVKSTNKINVCGSSLMQVTEMSVEELAARMGITGSPCFVVQPLQPCGLTKLQGAVIKELQSDFRCDTVVEAMLALSLINANKAAMLLGDPLLRYLQEAKQSLHHCLRCTAPFIPHKRLKCPVCFGTQVTRLRPDEVSPWQTLRQNSSRCPRKALQVDLEGLRPVCFTWVEGGPMDALMYAKLVKTLALFPASDASFVYFPFSDGGTESYFIAPKSKERQHSALVDVDAPFVAQFNLLLEQAQRRNQTFDVMTGEYLWVSKDPRDGSWVQYDYHQNELEKAYLSGQTEVEVSFDGFGIFKLNFKLWKQINQKGYCRAIRRIPGQWICSECECANQCSTMYCIACSKPLNITYENDPYMRPGGYYYNKVVRKPHVTYLLAPYEVMEAFHYDPVQDCLVKGCAREWVCTGCGNLNSVDNIGKCTSCREGTGDPASDARLTWGGSLYKWASSKGCMACRLKGCPCDSVGYYVFPDSYGEKMKFKPSDDRSSLVAAHVLDPAQLRPGGDIYEYIKAKYKGLTHMAIYNEDDLPSGESEADPGKRGRSSPEVADRKRRLCLIYRGPPMDCLVSVRILQQDDGELD